MDQRRMVRGNRVWKLYLSGEDRARMRKLLESVRRPNLVKLGGTEKTFINFLVDRAVEKWTETN